MFRGGSYTVIKDKVYDDNEMSDDVLRIIIKTAHKLNLLVRIKAEGLYMGLYDYDLDSVTQFGNMKQDESSKYYGAFIDSIKKSDDYAELVLKYERADSHIGKWLGKYFNFGSSRVNVPMVKSLFGDEWYQALPITDFKRKTITSRMNSHISKLVASVKFEDTEDNDLFSMVKDSIDYDRISTLYTNDKTLSLKKRVITELRKERELLDSEIE